MARYKLKINGMSCGHCVRAVRGALEAIPGVQAEDVSVGSAVVDLEDPGLMAKITAAIEDEDFKVEEHAEI